MGHTHIQNSKLDVLDVSVGSEYNDDLGAEVITKNETDRDWWYVSLDLSDNYSYKS